MFVLIEIVLLFVVLNGEMVEVGSFEVVFVRFFLGFIRIEVWEYCDFLGLFLWFDLSNMLFEIDCNCICY